MQPDYGTERQWADYITALTNYVNAMIEYSAAFRDGGENPAPLKPPRPPFWNGFDDEEHASSTEHAH